MSHFASVCKSVGLRNQTNRGIAGTGRTLLQTMSCRRPTRCWVGGDMVFLGTLPRWKDPWLHGVSSSDEMSAPRWARVVMSLEWKIKISKLSFLGFGGSRSISWEEWYPLFQTSDDSAHGFQTQGELIIVCALSLVHKNFERNVKIKMVLILGKGICSTAHETLLALPQLYFSVNQLQ